VLHWFAATAAAATAAAATAAAEDVKRPEEFITSLSFCNDHKKFFVSTFNHSSLRVKIVLMKMFSKFSRISRIATFATLFLGFIQPKGWFTHSKGWSTDSTFLFHFVRLCTLSSKNFKC